MIYRSNLGVLESTELNLDFLQECQSCSRTNTLPYQTLKVNAESALKEVKRVTGFDVKFWQIASFDQETFTIVVIVRVIFIIRVIAFVGRT